MPKRVPQYKPPGYDRMKAAAKRAYDNNPQRKADKDFYMSSPWRGLRQQKLNLNPTCEKCLPEGRAEEAKYVHHIKERHTHPELELELSNLQSLCAACHVREHNLRRSGKR